MFTSTSIENRYRKIKRKQLEEINQSIVISDVLIVQALKYKNGEAYYKQSNYVFDDFTSHIKLLGDIANQHHENLYCEKIGNFFQIKESCKNKITRLVLNEFSLYPADRPLTLEEFRKTIQYIETLANHYCPNLILVLSSLPVEIPNRGVQNYVIHVQCGPDAKIHTLAKITPSKEDPVYHGKKNVYYSPDYINGLPPDQVALTQLPEKNNELGQTGINYSGLIPCETAGGAKFITAIDICLDHGNGEAKKNFFHFLNGILLNQNSELLPNQISHIVTSCCIDMHPQNMIAKTLTHADPLIKLFSPFPYTASYSSQYSMKSQEKSEDHFAKIYEQLMKRECIEFENCQTNYSNGLYYIKNPAFGSQLVIKCLIETPLDRLSGSLSIIVNNHNQQIQEGLRSYSKEIKQTALYNKIILHEITKRLNHQINYLKNKQHFPKKLFHLNDSTKQQINLIHYYLTLLNHLANNGEYFRLDISVILENFKQKAVAIRNSKKLVSELDSILQTLIDYPHRSRYRLR